MLIKFEMSTTEDIAIMELAKPAQIDLLLIQGILCL